MMIAIGTQLPEALWWNRVRWKVHCASNGKMQFTDNGKKYTSRKDKRK